MKVRMIYLAAGNGRRFRESIQDNNVNKLLYPLDGLPIWRHLYDRLERIVVRHPEWELVVVSRYEEILQHVEISARERCMSGRIMGIYSPDSEKGASYSVKAGLAAQFRESADIITKANKPYAYAFFVADQPYLTEKHAEAFLATMEKEHAKLGSVICKGVPGNPAWFASDYKEELLALDGDRGGRRVLNAHPEQVSYYEVQDEACLHDIDTFGEKD